MKVTLNIQEDSELRAHIKDAIKGQILSIIRSEVNGLFKDVLGGRIEKSLPVSIENLVKLEISKYVQAHLKGNGWDSSGFVREEAKRLVTEHVNNSLKNFNPFK